MSNSNIKFSELIEILNNSNSNGNVKEISKRSFNKKNTKTKDVKGKKSCNVSVRQQLLDTSHRRMQRNIASTSAKPKKAPPKKAQPKKAQPKKRATPKPKLRRTASEIKKLAQVFIDMHRQGIPLSSKQFELMIKYHK